MTFTPTAFMTVFHLVNSKDSMSSAPLYLDAVNVIHPPFLVIRRSRSLAYRNRRVDPSIPALGQHQAYQVREAAFACQAYATSQKLRPICTKETSKHCAIRWPSTTVVEAMPYPRTRTFLFIGISGSPIFETKNSTDWSISSTL